VGGAVKVVVGIENMADWSASAAATRGDRGVPGLLLGGDPRRELLPR